MRFGHTIVAQANNPQTQLSQYLSLLSSTHPSIHKSSKTALGTSHHINHIHTHYPPQQTIQQTQQTQSFSPLRPQQLTPSSSHPPKPHLSPSYVRMLKWGM